MAKIELKARAKINLTLDILDRRPDGYHEVEMVMQTIELHDLLVIEEAERGIELTTDNPLLFTDETNLAYRAAKLFMNNWAADRGIRIRISKNIPVAAGLAGGSADAAAVLKGLNLLWNLGLGKEELARKAAEIGSDVPFCVREGTALARGRGEIISALPDVPEIWLVLAKPPLQVSTAEVYQNYNSAQVNQRPKTGSMIKAIRAGNVDGIIENLANVLESVTLSKYPEVSELKGLLEKYGARRALMSGSGPTVFGIVNSRAGAEQVKDRLRDRMPGIFVQVSRTWPADQQEFNGNG